jgi:hypothetical protein
MGRWGEIAKQREKEEKDPQHGADVSFLEFVTRFLLGHRFYFK